MHGVEGKRNFGEGHRCCDGEEVFLQLTFSGAGELPRGSDRRRDLISAIERVRRGGKRFSERDKDHTYEKYVLWCKRSPLWRGRGRVGEGGGGVFFHPCVCAVDVASVPSSVRRKHQLFSPCQRKVSSVHFQGVAVLFLSKGKNPLNLSVCVAHCQAKSALLSSVARNEKKSGL